MEQRTDCACPERHRRATFPQTFGTPDPSLGAELVGDLNGDGVQDLLLYGPVTSWLTFTSNGKGGYNAGAVQPTPALPGRA